MKASINLVASKDAMLAEEIQNRFGFVTEAHISRLAEIVPAAQLLVRCGNGRFLVKAQDAKWFIDIVTREGTDHVRDVSLPA